MANLHDPKLLKEILERAGYAPHFKQGTPERKEIKSEGIWRKWVTFYLKREYANHPVSLSQVGEVVAVIEIEMGGMQSSAMLMKSCEVEDLF